MSSWFASILNLGDRVLDRVLPNRAKLQEKNLDINAETERASGSGLTPRRLMMYLLCLLFAWEVMARPLIVTYWPSLTLPPSMLKDVMAAISAMFGMGI